MRLLAIIAAFSFVSCVNVKEYAADLIKKTAQDKYLKAHNSLRESLGRSALTWNEDLEGISKAAAEHLAIECSHKPKEPYLNSIYQSWCNMITTPKDVIESWQQSKGEEYKTIIYKYTDEVGCAFAVCKEPSSLARSVIHVCNYDFETILERVLKK